MWVQAQKNGVRGQLDVLAKSRETARQNINSMKSTIKYTSVEQIDSRIVGAQGGRLGRRGGVWGAGARAWSWSMRGSREGVAVVLAGHVYCRGCCGEQIAARAMGAQCGPGAAGVSMWAGHLLGADR